MPTYLLTGANRGIGLGLSTALLQRANTTLLACVRTPSHPTSQALLSLPHDPSSRVILLRIDSADHNSAATAIAHLQNEHPDVHDKGIDVVIANAGISSLPSYLPASAVPLEAVREHFEINTLAPLALWQACLGLLRKSKNPRFMAVSSSLGSLEGTGEFKFPVTAYGSSKAALNYVIRKCHWEEDGVVAFSVCPGWVRTDMGTAAAKSIGMEDAPSSVEDSVKGLLNVIDNATREKTSGTFQSLEGGTIPW